jgi:hypothetical protein
MPTSAPSRARRLAGAAAASAALALVLLAACSDDATAPGAARLVYGPSQPLGDGTARTYVALDRAGAPVSVGVAISATAMQGLPMTPMPGMPMAAMLNLTLPAEAAPAGYDHVMLDWMPTGHEPNGVYTLPHFDLHFYTIPVAEQNAIVPSDPQFAAKLAKMPAEEYRPAGMIMLPGGVPMMGAHWADPAAPELQPPPNAQPFTRTFFYGSYDGHFIFFEPMITKAHLESFRTGAPVEVPLKVPARYERPGYYPTKYRIAFDAAAQEYRVSLEGLVRQN